MKRPNTYVDDDLYDAEVIDAYRKRVKAYVRRCKKYDETPDYTYVGENYIPDFRGDHALQLRERELSGEPAIQE